MATSASEPLKAGPKPGAFTTLCIPSFFPASSRKYQLSFVATVCLVQSNMATVRELRRSPVGPLSGGSSFTRTVAVTIPSFRETEPFSRKTGVPTDVVPMGSRACAWSVLPPAMAATRSGSKQEREVTGMGTEGGVSASGALWSRE